MNFRSVVRIFFSFILFAIIVVCGSIPLLSSKAKKEIILNSKNYPEITLNTPFNKDLHIAETEFPARVCNIVNYGAIGDGKTKNTQAFANAISDCAQQGGGKVEVPPGTWLTGPIHLESNINLDIQKGAQINFSIDFKDYLPVVFSRFEGIEYYNFSPPIYAKNAHNIAITGKGSLNGEGQNWWNLSILNYIKKLYEMGEANVPVNQRIFGTTEAGLRPAFVEFVNCQRVLIKNITLVNGPMWTVHPLYSQNIVVKNINIQTQKGPSTDGVVIDSSQNVLVENTTFSTGDDAITIKSGRDNDGRRVGIPSKNIVLQNCTIDNAHGAIAIGSEMSGDVENVLAQNFTVRQAQYGFRIKSNAERGGIAQNIWIKNLKIDALSVATIKLNTHYERRSTQYKNYPPSFRNIHIDGVTCQATKDSISLIGLKDDSAMKNIDLKNINILYARNGLQMDYVNNTNLSNINISPKYGPPFTIINSKNIALSNSGCPASKPVCLTISGNSSQNINLVKNSFDQQPKKISIDKDVDKSQLKVH